MVVAGAFAIIYEGVPSRTLLQFVSLPLDVSIYLKMKISCENIVLECAFFLRMVMLVLLLELHVKSLCVLIEHLFEGCQ